MERQEISWSAPEYEHHEKSAGWYWITVLIATFILALSIWMDNFLFGMFVIIAEVLLIIWANKEPREVLLKLDSEGLTVDEKKTYLYKDIENFSVDDIHRGEWLMIVFKLKRKLRLKLEILSPKENIDEIREFLEEEAPDVPEVDFEVNLLDSIERLIRF